jgi:hypothetical protein
MRQVVQGFPFNSRDVNALVAALRPIIEEFGDRINKLLLGLNEDVVHQIFGQNRFRYRNTMVRAYKSTNQTSVAINTFATITFNAENFDTDTLHDNSTATARLTTQIPGQYLVMGRAYLITTGVTTPTNVALRILRNGAAVAETLIPTAAGSNDYMIGVTSLLSLAAADYVELQAQVMGASGTYTIDGASQLTHFEMAYMGE